MFDCSDRVSQRKAEYSDLCKKQIDAERQSFPDALHQDSLYSNLRKWTTS
jgi:hypothetical protein